MSESRHDLEEILGDCALWWPERTDLASVARSNPCALLAGHESAAMFTDPRLRPESGAVAFERPFNSPAPFERTSMAVLFTDSEEGFEL